MRQKGGNSGSSGQGVGVGGLEFNNCCGWSKSNTTVLSLHPCSFPRLMRLGK